MEDTNSIPTTTLSKDKSNNYIYFSSLTAGNDYVITLSVVTSVTLESNNLDSNVSLSIYDEDGTQVLSVSGNNVSKKAYLDATKNYYMEAVDNSAKYVIDY